MVAIPENAVTAAPSATMAKMAHIHIAIWKLIFTAEV
jgi:hypothetical protein